MNQLGTQLLEAERIILRKITMDDHEAMYHNWACLEECSRYFPWSACEDIEIYKKRVSMWVGNYKDDFYFNWLIEWNENKEVIGIINLHNVDEDNQSAETSYILAPKYWGQGIMTEALARVLRFAFDDLKLNRVEADVFAGNVASEKVLTKCGMQREGISREKYCKDGVFIDSVQYAILAKDR